MKHKLKITLILLSMFIITQFLGLYVINHYFPSQEIQQGLNITAPSLPYGMQTPELKTQGEYYSVLPSIVIAFIFAILLFIFLKHFNLAVVMRIWFFVVVIIALGITINAFLPQTPIASIFALVIALPLAFEKIFKRNIPIHNLTELMIYPGIAAVFVSIFNIWTILIILIIISIYDIWAVWHSGLMLKMVKFQIEKVQVFGGYLIPVIDEKTKLKIEKMRAFSKSKQEKLAKSIKVNVAVLGGGDVVFPLITAGVFFTTAGFGLIPALCVIAGATLGLCYLFFFGEKKKAYPAMPYITAGIFLALLVHWLVF